MAKKVTKVIKLQLPAGKAAPTQKVGPALGQAGINIGDFISKFNAATQQMGDDVVPVEISVYEDRSYSFALKTPPVPHLIKKAAKIEKGSGKNTLSRAGTISQADVRAIAEKKMPDLNTHSIEAAMRMVAGTARSMGVEVV